MPEVNVVPPATAVPEDRLVLGTSDVRSSASVQSGCSGCCTPCGSYCMAEE